MISHFILENKEFKNETWMDKNKKCFSQINKNIYYKFIKEVNYYKQPTNKQKNEKQQLQILLNKIKNDCNLLFFKKLY